MAKEKNTLFGNIFSRLTERLAVKAPEIPKSVTPRKLPQLKLIFFIIDWTKTGDISKVFEDEKVRFHFISKGRGTASSDVLDLLGIGAGDKAVVLCLEQQVLVPVLLAEVRKKLGFHSPGAGIAFTVPLSGINTPILRVFKESIHNNEKIAAVISGAPIPDSTESENSEAAEIEEKQQFHRRATDRKGEKTMAEIKNDLIISIINQGFSDEFMTVAREAGASGGTVLGARGLAHEGPVKFFGVSVQAEKEIVIILTNREKKETIMKAVSESCGLSSKAEGLVFSLPVDSVMGLSFE
jgi:hypothetical protein